MTQIGLLLPTRESMLYGDRRGDPKPLVELAVAAEEAGFDSVWAGDSLLARPRPEPLALLAGVATVTSRVLLGTAVLLPVLRHPVFLAQQAATIDQLSDGRLILGVGAAADNADIRREHAAVGADFTRRASTMVATMQRCRDLWVGADEEIGAILPGPSRPGGPPIWVGGSGPRTLERTGRFFDGWFPLAVTPEQFATGWATVLAHAADAGRPAGTLRNANYVTITVGEPEAAAAQQKEHMEAYYGVPFEVMRRFQGGVAGSLETCFDWLQGFVDAGVEHLVVRFGSGDPFGQLEAAAPMLRELQGATR